MRKTTLSALLFTLSLCLSVSSFAMMCGVSGQVDEQAKSLKSLSENYKHHMKNAELEIYSLEDHCPGWRAAHKEALQKRMEQSKAE
jgi:hypothetical protein